ncbi:MAG: hypothetical protein RJA70_1238 [Pseudomonadota bacterium]
MEFTVSGERFTAGLLLSVAETGGQVWAVGGRAGKTAVLRRAALESSAEFEPVENPGEHIAWWVCELGGDLALVGDAGMVLVYSRGKFEELDLGVTSTLYGCAGSSKDDFWVVGGDPLSGPPELIHVVGGEGTAPDLGVEASQLPKVFFKIVQVGKQLFIVGDSGTVLHRESGGDWKLESLSREPLFTVSATSADDVWAVGGRTSGVLFHFDGEAWERQRLPSVPGLFGVSATAHGVLAVGHAGTILEQLSTDSGAKQGWQDRSVDTGDVFHAVWQADDGRAWATGGNVLEPLDRAWHGIVVGR